MIRRPLYPPRDRSWRDVSRPGYPDVGPTWEEQLADDTEEVRRTLIDYLLGDTWSGTEGMSLGRRAATVRARWPTLWRDAGVRRSDFFEGRFPRELLRQIDYASRGQLRLYIHDWILQVPAAGRGGRDRRRGRPR